MSKNKDLTYSSYMREIHKDELMEGLLSHGLFAKEIPPIFTSELFYEWCKSIENEDVFQDPEKNRDGSHNKNKKGEPKNFYDNKDFIRYESMRNICIPRLLAIPHPIAYRNLCKTLSDSWDRLQEYFEKKTQLGGHKISRLHIRKLKDKQYLFEMNYKDFEKEIDTIPDLSIGAEVMVKADISNCFPSIYTHSIPWALIDKEKAKKCRDEREYFNKIDKFTRNLKCGETHGILIGPHSSNLISEIILVAIDYALYNKGYRYIRHIDDYTCYLKNRDEAEKFLLDLSVELKKYELTLNHKKTEMLDLPLASDDYWVRKLNTFCFADKKNPKDKSKKLYITRKEVGYYLDLAISLALANKENNAAIINYVIKVISNKCLDEQTKRYYLKRIHHLVLLYPYLIPLLDEHIFESLGIDSKEIKSISNNIFSLGKSKNLWEAVSYSIFFALKHKFKLDGTRYLTEKAINSDDCIFLMLAYLYKKQNKNQLSKYIQLAKKKLDDNFAQYWLFVYEVLSADELPEPFKSMKKKGICFIQKDYL